MTKNFETLKQVVLELSESDSFEEAVKEWDYNHLYREEGSTCACGKKPITNVCCLENSVNGNQLEVGNECVHYFDMDFTMTFDQLKKEEKFEKNAKKYEKEIAELETIKEKSGEWEKEFLSSIINCYKNDWKLSIKQHEIVSKIKNNFYGNYPPEVQYQIDVLSKCTTNSEWEQGFLESIINQVKLQRDISGRQWVYLLRILHKNNLNKADLRLPKENITKYTSEDFKSFIPRVWQVEAYNKWVLMDKKATIEAGTGIGKTKFALMALEQHPDDTFLIVVPTEYLQLQWEKEIKNIFGDRFEIGKIGGGYNEPNKQITIAIINSIRHTDMSRDFGVFDEFHRYGSEQNMSFLVYSSFNKVIGLTATIERPDNAHIQLLEQYPICYTITQKEGIDEGYLCSYKIINEKTPLNREEHIEYVNADMKIKALFPLFGYDYKQMQTLMMQGHSDAKDLNQAFNTRKKVLNNAANKIPKVLELIKRHTKEQVPKTIIFSALKTTANKIYTLLKKEGLAVGIYHSGLKTKERIEMMDKFANDEFRIMVSVRALNEGIDIPNCKLGILVAGHSVKRDWIQQTGRILRKSGDESAIMYQIYIPGTQDEKWAKKRLESVEKGIEVVW